LWLHSLKVSQLLRSAAYLHTNQSRSYLNHLVCWSIRALFGMEELYMISATVMSFLKIGILKAVISLRGARGGLVVKALSYKPASRGFDSRSVIGIFQ